RVVLLDGRTALPPRSTGWVQLVLRVPVLALRGDRFVLRDQTARWTVGGGVVVHPFAERHRSGSTSVSAMLRRLGGVDDAAPAASTSAPSPPCAPACWSRRWG